MFDNLTSGDLTKERNKARELKKSRWWQNLIQKCECYYCNAALSAKTVTMDHIVPISRGGRSTKGNVVPSCHTCNVEKRSLTPVEWNEYLERRANRDHQATRDILD